MDLLTIGAFAAATGLTVPALRHYDEVGLLKPARTDPDTGYRRYHPDQLDEARLVCSLRAMGVPIDEVRAMVAAPPDELRAALDGHRERLATQLREVSHRIEAVDEYLAKGTLMPPVQSVRPVQLRIGVADVARAAGFYTEAFDAVYLPDISSVQFGAFRTDRFFLLTLEQREGCTRFGLLVGDVDTAHARALQAGAAEVHPPEEFTYKPRTSCIRDPYGNVVDLSQA